MTLTENPIRWVEFRGKRVRIRTAYWRVLTCFSVLDDPMLENMEKLETCLRLLIPPRPIFRFSSKEKAELFRAIFDQFINANPVKSTSNEKHFDFIQDANYIVAAFWQCYGIDLFHKGRSLHWWVFQSLLNGLSDDTKLMQIISIRCRKIPKPTKYNAEERRELLRLKQVYRLKISEEERKQQFQRGLANIATMLQGMASKQ